MIRLSRHTGLTLVELLVALSIGAVLALGVVNVFIGNSKSAKVERALAQVQQSGRAAIELINKDIRRAGYIGCTSVGGRIDVAASGLEVQRVLAYTASGGGLSPDPTGQAAAVIASDARAGTDVLVLDYSEYLGNDLIAAADSFSAIGTQIELDDTEAPDESRECELGDGDLVLFSNCLTTHLFRISSASGCGTSNTLQINAIENAGAGAGATFQYDAGSDVAEYLQFIWYVADTERDVNGQDVYALYRLPSNQPAATPEEMVEGVEYLRLEIGERVGTSLRYVEPDTPGIDWDNVEAVRIALLVQSFDSVTDAADATVYQLLNTTVGPTGLISHGRGQVVRRVYTSSQVIRNTEYGI